MHSFSDAGRPSNIDMTKSRLFKLDINSGEISWSCKLTKSASTSVAEAELKAVVESVKEAVDFETKQIDENFKGTTTIVSDK